MSISKNDMELLKKRLDEMEMRAEEDSERINLLTEMILRQANETRYLKMTLSNHSGDPLSEDGYYSMVYGSKRPSRSKRHSSLKIPAWSDLW